MLWMGIWVHPSADTPLEVGVGVYIVMVCRWTDHILARNPFLEVEADLPDGDNFPTRFSLIKLESNE
jgi:hypothetical protein